MSPKKIEISRGCPFTGFGPCAGLNCLFYLPTLDSSDTHACLITGGYVKALFNTIILQQALFGTELPGSQADFLFPAFANRACESLASALAGLETLLASPHTDPDLKVFLEETRAAVRKNLKGFLRS